MHKFKILHDQLNISAASIMYGIFRRYREIAVLAVIRSENSAITCAQ